MAADNEIKVLLTADLGDLKAGMDAAAESVAASSEAMAASAQESAAAIQAAHTSVAETAEQAAARIKAMVAASLEQAAADAQLGESERSLAERMGLRVEATDAQLDATAATIAAQNEQMAAASSLASTEEGVAAATDAATVAIEANTEAMVVNGGVARELGVLTGEALRGNWTRLEGSTITLANRMNLLQYAFTPVGIAAIVAAGGVIAFVAEVVKGVEQSEQFNKALINTGGELGVTEGQFNQMASAITGLDTPIGTAREALIQLAQSGRFSGEALRTAGSAAVDFAALTGLSMDQAVAAVIKLEEKPVEALVNLNNQYHFLTAAQFEHVQQLQQEGRETEAATEAVKLFQQATSERLKQSDEDVGTLVKWWRELKGAISEAADEVESFGRKQTLEEQITQLQRQIEDTKKGYVTLGEAFGHKFEVYNPFHPMRADVSLLEQQLDALQKKAGDARYALSQKAAAQGGQDAQINADAKSKTSGGSSTQAQAATESLQQQLSIQESIEKVSYAQRAQYELAFWQQKLTTLKQGTTEYAQAYAQVATLSNQIERQKTQAAEQAAQQQRQIEQADIQSREQHELSILDLKKQEIATAAQLGQMGATEELQQLAALEQQKYQIELAAMQQRRALASGDVLQVKQVNDQILALQDQHNKAMAQLNQKAALDNQKMWQDRLRPISQAFQGVINGFIQGTQNWRQATAKVLESVAAEYIQKGIEIVVNHAANEAAKTTATATGAAARTTIEATAAAQSKATDAATGKSQIGTAAATGAAKAYQAIVGIPYVGPILAPIAAGVAFAGIEAFSASIASARGGWDRVPFDGAMTELHKDEMVLPANIANPMRQMAKQGGQGGQPIHIHATDPRSFKDYMRRNPAAIASAIKLAGRRGHMLGAR